MDQAAAVLLLIALVFGTAFPAVGLICGFVAARLRGRERVNVRVTDIRVGRPRFEVIDGPHRGRADWSNTQRNPPAHKVGDVVTGYLNPFTGSIESEGTIGTLVLLRKVFVWVGLGLGGTLVTVAALLYLVHILRVSEVV